MHIDLAPITIDSICNPHMEHHDLFTKGFAFRPVAQLFICCC